MRTGNPSLNKNAFANLEHVSSSDAMSVNGTIQKTFLSLALVLVTAGYVWNEFYTNGFGASMTGILLGGVIIGAILAIITVFNKRWSPVTVPIYALVEGAVLGLISAFFEGLYPGVVMQAVTLTLGVLLVMLYLYRSQIIKVTQKLKMGIIMATGSIMIIYLLSWVLSFIGLRIPLIHEGGPVGIIFSLVVVGIAAFNLLLDFDFIEKAAKKNVPKYMEWYGAFGLLVTLIWLYIEILRLLSKMRSNN